MITISRPEFTEDSIITTIEYGPFLRNAITSRIPRDGMTLRQAHRADIIFALKKLFLDEENYIPAVEYESNF